MVRPWTWRLARCRLQLGPLHCDWVEAPAIIKKYGLPAHLGASISRCSTKDEQLTIDSSLCVSNPEWRRVSGGKRLPRFRCQVEAMHCGIDRSAKLRLAAIHVGCPRNASHTM